MVSSDEMLHEKHGLLVSLKPEASSANVFTDDFLHLGASLSLQEDDPDGVKVVLQIGSSFLGKKKKKKKLKGNPQT